MSLLSRLFKKKNQINDKDKPVVKDYGKASCSTPVKKNNTASDKKKDLLNDKENTIGKNSDIAKSSKQDQKKVMASDKENYKIVTIGDQVWMAENLKVTCYRNGDPMHNAIEDSEWTKLGSDEMKKGAYCVYDNDIENLRIYGYLYNWDAVNDKRNIAPEGWHVATDEDWKVMEVHLGISQTEADDIGWRGIDQGGMLKEVGTMHWNSINSGATNNSGFTALAGGLRDGSGEFLHLRNSGYFWTATNKDKDDAWYRQLGSGNPSGIYRHSNFKSIGFSVRCIKD